MIGQGSTKAYIRNESRKHLGIYASYITLTLRQVTMTDQASTKACINDISRKG